jgi:predicted DNA-binding protein
MEATKDQVLHIRLTRRELDRLERLARYTRRTRSNAVRWLIATAQWLRRR